MLWHLYPTETQINRIELIDWTSRLEYCDESPMWCHEQTVQYVGHSAPRSAAAAALTGYLARRRRGYTGRWRSRTPARAPRARGTRWASRLGGTRSSGPNIYIVQLRISDQCRSTETLVTLETRENSEPCSGGALGRRRARGRGYLARAAAAPAAACGCTCPHCRNTRSPPTHS